MGRYWGFWTRGKLELLRDYLDAFTTAGKRVEERLYLDIFGGQPDNTDRLTGEPLDGSARIALETANPAFTRLRFCELEPHASRLETTLRSDFPDRDFSVTPGDCNDSIHDVLEALAPYAWAPTFAFVDPNGPHIQWSTLEALARFKRASKYKTEIWLLLAAGISTRMLPADGSVRPDDARRFTAMYGTDQWRTIYEARVGGGLTPREAREEYVNLMRWRLENTLGYRWTHPLEVVNERGGSMYHMIFASDNDAGTRIMSHLYAEAAVRFPAMREQARRRRAQAEHEAKGLVSLFGDDADFMAPIQPGERLYEHLPAHPPAGS